MYGNVTIEGGGRDNHRICSHHVITHTNLGVNLKIILITSGDGNDSLWGSAGDHTIESSVDSENVLFQYNGEVKDHIYGFNATSTFQITSSTFNSVITLNGRDYLLNVGYNLLTLEKAASINNINIVDSTEEQLNSPFNSAMLS